MADEVDVEVVEERVRAVAEDEPPFVAGGPGLADFLSSGPGIVIDPAVAREAPCIGYELAEQSRGAADVVFTKGIAGPLDEEQIEAYCESIDVRSLTDEQRERLAAFHEAAAVCDTEGGEDGIEARLGCLGRELQARGQKF